MIFFEKNHLLITHPCVMPLDELVGIWDALHLPVPLVHTTEKEQECLERLREALSEVKE